MLKRELRENWKETASTSWTLRVGDWLADAHVGNAQMTKTINRSV